MGEEDSPEGGKHHNIIVLNAKYVVESKSTATKMCDYAH